MDLSKFLWLNNFQEDFHGKQFLNNTNRYVLNRKHKGFATFSGQPQKPQNVNKSIT